MVGTMEFGNIGMRARVFSTHAAIAPEMAIRLEKAGWSNAEFWLRRQTTDRAEILYQVM